MRVGIVVYGLDRQFHGIGRYTVDLTGALAAAAGGPDLLLLAAGAPGPLTATGLPVVRLPGCRLLPGLLALGSAWLPLLAARHHLDVIHDPTGVAPFLVGAGPARTVVTLHDVIPWSYPGVSTALDTWIYRVWLPRVLPRVDAVLTVSHASRADLLRYLPVLPARTHVVPEAPNPAFRPAPLAAIARVKRRYQLPDQYMLAVGAVTPRKNLARLLHAFARLRAQGVPHHLVVVGPRRLRYPGLSDLVRMLGLEQAVRFTGYADDADLPALYSGAEVFIFPSLYEGFGLPAVEAMACGVPVVASNVSSLPEVLGDAALLVDPYDVRAIADAIQRVLTDHGLRAELVRRGFARLRMFGPERIADGVLAVYERVLMPSPRYLPGVA